MSGKLVPRIDSIRYDGENSAEVITWFTDLATEYVGYLSWTVETAEEDGGNVVITTTSPFANLTVEPGMTMYFRDLSFSVYADDEARDIYTRPLPSLVESVGTATVPGQAGGGTHNVDVTISPAMSSTSFEPDISLRGNAALVGGHSVLGHTVLSASSVRVQFNSTALSQNITVRVVAREVV